MTKNIEIIIGTYEEFLLGYKLDNENAVLTQSFADKSHTGALKCLAICGKFVASGGTDDRIFIYDMKTRKQSQILLSHEGTVNTVAFTPDNTHLLSGGSDGRMVAVRLNTWVAEGTWKKAHSGSPVSHISCHPSGKLALSLGTDLVLRTWNLVKGRVAYKTNLKSKTSLGSAPDCLAWSLTGDYFTITGQRVIEIWSIKKADVLKSVKTNSKPICLAWINDSSVLVGLEDGKIVWLTVDLDDELISFEAHQSRVKAMCFQNNTLVTASSTGEIKIWNVDSTNKTMNAIVSTSIGCRPTCIGILDLNQFGPDYVLNKVKIPTEKEESVRPMELDKKQPQQRGVVIIEYENDGNISSINDDKQKTLEKSDTESSEEEKSVTERSEEEIEASDKSSEEDSDAEISNDDQNSEDDVPQKSKKRRQNFVSLPQKLKNRKLGHANEKNNSKKLKQAGAYVRAQKQTSK